jgi:ketosteroid isomerase-like protein
MLPLYSKFGFVAISMLMLSATGLSQKPPEATKPASCSAPEFRQLDFWAGDWDAFDYDNQKQVVAHARVSKILDDCVLLENYQDPNGLHGQSFSIYDPSRKVWHQTWVTNRGQLLVIEGKQQDGEVVLSGTDYAKNVEVRGVWKPSNGGVRETAVTSSDSGKTWQPWFDLVFRPHANSTSADESAVAKLDTEYQTAVEKNDAATMDRLLDDKFTLVTGAGKIYTKADLLEEARSGRIRYERQDDSAQAVHVWGDTAVVTAKLFTKGTEAGKPFEYMVWFSDTYVRTPNGWRYVFGQSSLPLPKSQ